MSKNKNTFYFKIFILLTIFIVSGLLIIDLNRKNNISSNIIISKTDNKDLNNENTSDFKLDFELQSVTIKENETYQITNFISESDRFLLKNIDYTYKEESMSTYREIGKYEIIIIFKNIYGNKIEKNTSLTIEKKTTIIDDNNKENNIIKSNNIIQNTSSSNQTTKSNTVIKDDIENQILANNQNIGTHGRLYFESLYSVALYKPLNSDDAQKIVDNKDSAAYFQHVNIMMIADHAYQGFNIIKTQNVGNFIYIKKPSTNGTYILEKYIIKEKTIGKNTGTNLITNDNRVVETDVNYSLALYTCNTSDGYEVTILLLDKV